jgi:hypothetical protein
MYMICQDEMNHKRKQKYYAFQNRSMYNFINNFY